MNKRLVAPSLVHEVSAKQRADGQKRSAHCCVGLLTLDKNWDTLPENVPVYPLEKRQNVEAPSAAV